MLDNIKNFFIKYRIYIICLMCGVIIGLVIAFIVYRLQASYVVDLEWDSQRYFDSDDNAKNLDADIDKIDGTDIKDDISDNTYDEIIENYKIYLQSRKVGDEVVLGQYEQDNNIYNGKEDIKWLVLYKSNKNSMMLISKDILDCMPYDFSKKTVTWKDSDVRDFLNHDFYDTAFNDMYRLFIMENDMTNSPNVNYKTSGGDETKDKVFLLSESQAKKYFAKNEKDGSNVSRIAKATEYAKGKGVAIIVDKNVWYDGCSSYYLRTPGVDQGRVEMIEPNGAIYEYGELVSSTEVGIRPCIWVKY